MPKFSVITPVYLDTQDRVEQFLVCIQSVKNQTFKDFEWVVIDDGSIQPFLWDNLLNGFTLNLVHKNNENRIIAYNTAFQIAKGDWWIFLDSDDELAPNCLEILNEAIRKNPKSKMFNFGCIYKYKDTTETKRKPFEPEWLGRKYGHEQFGGGNVVNGTFVFHRSVYEKLGGFPPAVIENIDCSAINYGTVQPRNLYMTSPYDVAAWFLMTFPEQRRYFMVDHEAEPDKIIKEIGNPWGNDHMIYYKFTRKYHSKPINEYLYIVHPK